MKMLVFEFSNFSFANLFYLIIRLIIYFYFLILMTGRASNLTLKLVLHHDELKNVNHVVIRSTLAEVSGIQLLFHWIGLKKLVQKHVYHNLVCALSPEIPGGGEAESSPPTYITYNAKKDQPG